jgi:hypothetical protein
MYVHFAYSTGDPEIIREFDVRDMDKGSAPAPPPDPGPGATGSHLGRVTAVDTRVAQIAVMLDQGGIKAFQAANARVLAGVRPGDRVTLVTESQNGQDIVVEVRRR